MKTFILNKYQVILQNETLVQALKYFIVGGICTVLDLVMLFALTNYMGMNYVYSSVISFMSGTILNYYLCIWWIFKVRVVEKRHHEFLYYLIITGIGLGINTLVIWGMTEYAEFHFMASKLVAIFITYWWNFGARKYFLHTIR